MTVLPVFATLYGNVSPTMQYTLNDVGGDLS
jgi:hypothetical protein